MSLVNENGYQVSSVSTISESDRKRNERAKEQKSRRFGEKEGKETRERDEEGEGRGKKSRK